MESLSTRLANRINTQSDILHAPVSARLLEAFPEINTMLRLEEMYSPNARLKHVAVERLSKLVQAMLIFEMPEIADQELQWAANILPRSGVTYDQQSSMVRWFFEELRQLNLDSDESSLAQDIEHYLIGVVRNIYHPFN